MQPLRISLIQGNTRWHDAAANRTYYGARVQGLAGDTDLAVLPETFLTGFTNDTSHQFEAIGGPSLLWLQDLAVRSGITITGSVIVEEAGRFYNRLLWLRPDGTSNHYDKRHLFRMSGEHHHFAAGTVPLTVELEGWRIRPMVCYDLRFPVWIRNRRLEASAGGMEYDLLLFVANWPAARRNAWSTLLRARAIENLSYCAGVNRVGVDGNGLHYAGDSALINPLGEALVELNAEQQVVTCTLNPAELLRHRQRFPAWMDADDFSLNDGRPGGPA